MQIGILALQGGVAEHKASLNKLSVNVIEVRLPADLEGIDALVIPGGESTAISKLLLAYSLINPLKDKIEKGLPVLGTCAGIILLAKDILDEKRVDNFSGLDIVVCRNAYGRQVDSFEAELEMTSIGISNFPGVFIRAPIIESVTNGVEILCTYNARPVAVRERKLVGCTFHPELTDDLRLHKYFLGMI